MTWQEVIPPGEAEVFEGYAQELKGYQAEYAAKRGKHERTLHTKGHVNAVGELAVAAPPELRAGVFAEARAWPVLVRYSSGSPGHQGDGAPDIRGIAIKLVGVPGKKLIPGLEDAATQDFLFIQSPASGISNPHDFMHLVRNGRKGKALLLPRLIRALGFKRALRLVRGFLAMPKVRSLATATFYSAVPLRLGERAVKLALFATTPDDGVTHKGRDALRAELVQRLQQGPVSYRLCAQEFVDEQHTPIEDAAVEWKSPWTDLGVLTIPRQDVTSPRGEAVASQIEALSFDPWHALPEHRPLGAMMRARGPAYRESVIARGASAEPTSVPSLEGS